VDATKNRGLYLFKIWVNNPTSITKEINPQLWNKNIQITQNNFRLYVKSQQKSKISHLKSIIKRTLKGVFGKDC
jgi:hypothetical protein